MPKATRQHKNRKRKKNWSVLYGEHELSLERTDISQAFGKFRLFEMNNNNVWIASGDFEWYQHCKEWKSCMDIGHRVFENRIRKNRIETVNGKFSILSRTLIDGNCLWKHFLQIALPSARIRNRILHTMYDSRFLLLVWPRRKIHSVAQSCVLFTTAEKKMELNVNRTKMHC